jgi:DNA-nicking Smr family endonuclease
VPKRSVPPSADDIALFHEAIGPVRRLVEPAAEPPRADLPPPRPRSREADEALALHQSRFEPFSASPLGPGDVLEYLREGHSPRFLRRLKRGQYAVRDEIDLHRMTQAQAESALREFLAEARREGHGCVRIVHGKGLRSGDAGPVLKALVDRMLRLRSDVLAFASAPTSEGGGGAVLVLLTHG